MEDQKCPKCGAIYAYDLKDPNRRNKVPDMIAVKEYGMCKDCIVGSGEYNQGKAARIIREINNGGKREAK